MKRIGTAVCVAVLAVLGSASQGVGGELGVDGTLKRLKGEIDARPGMAAPVREFAGTVLLSLCANEVFVSSVQTQNAMLTPLSEIKSIDKMWIAAEDELPVQRQRLSNACARELKSVASRFPAVVEAFVMDNQGALVGASALTSDYWQGDEAKWQNSYRGAQGGIDVGKVKFDRSANAVLQQISLPVVISTGAIIGAVTYGIDINRVSQLESVAAKPSASTADRLSVIEKQLKQNADIRPGSREFACATLLPLCTRPLFVQFVQAQNARRTSLAEIQVLDKQWIAAEDELPIQKSMLGNACASDLRGIIASNPMIVEAFVMDDQGALVAASSLTSDYWQGDEAKWKNSYNGGLGGVDVGKAKFDRSANAVLQQISLPVISNDGRIIGAVTYGVAVRQ